MYFVKKKIRLLFVSVIMLTAMYFCSVSASAITINPVIHPTATPNQKGLVVLVSFNDVSILHSDAEWSNRFFGNSGVTVRNYYDETSGGKVIFGPAAETSGTANDGVVRIKMNCNHPGVAGLSIAEVGTAINGMSLDIINNIKSYVSFPSFDKNGDKTIDSKELCIMLVFAGYENSMTTKKPSVNGQNGVIISNLGNIGGVRVDSSVFSVEGELKGDTNNTMNEAGVACHEFGHAFGLKDLYGGNTSLYGMFSGYYSIMDYMGDGSTPGHFDAYSKIKLGYASPIIANRSGVYNVNSFNSSDGYNVLRINTSNPKEYFLVENREFNGFDAALQYDFCKNPGICIWHIDESGGDNSVTPLMVAVEKHTMNAQNKVLFSQEGGNTEFSSTTMQNSNLNSGADSHFKLEVISPKGDSMQVRITADEIYNDVSNTSPVIQSFTTSTNSIRNGSVNIKAIITDDKSTIQSVGLVLLPTSPPTGPYSPPTITDGWVMTGNNTYEMTVKPGDYITGNGIFNLGLQVTDAAGKSTTWKGVPVSVTVNQNLVDSNLALNKPVTASAQVSYEPASAAVNGTSYVDSQNVHDKWCSDVGYGNNSWLKVDLGSVNTINRWKVIHERGSGSSYTDYCTSDFRLQASDDGVNNWRDIDVVTGNTLGITDRPVASFRARYVRLYIDKADNDNCARIYEFQLYNDTINGIATDFDGRRISQISGTTRNLDGIHNSNSVVYSRNVTGFNTGTNPECSVRTNEFSHSRNSAVMISGTDNDTSYSYCYYTLYDNMNIAVTNKTALSYWLYPTNANSRFVGIDILFTDGTNMREYSAVDQNGTGMHPNVGRGLTNQWNYIKCNLGQYFNGKTIYRIMAAYDQPASTGQYKAYIDDLTIMEDYTTSYKGISADFEGQRLLPTSNWMKPFGAPDYLDTVANKQNVTGYSGGVPDCSPRIGEVSHSGSGALMLAGTDNNTMTSNVYFTVYDNLNLPVTSTTNLSYWLYPVNSASRFVGIDIEFTDGSCLRATSAVDYNGIPMHPNGLVYNCSPVTGGRGVVGQWNFITSNIGQWCNGKVIKKILAAYDQPASTGQFKAYLDDIIIKQ